VTIERRLNAWRSSTLSSLPTGAVLRSSLSTKNSYSFRTPMAVLQR
jgi:hypothetical protein